MRLLRSLLGSLKTFLLHAPSLPHYWMRHLVNCLMWVLPDDQLSAVLRTAILRIAGVKAGRGAMVRHGAKFGGFRISMGEFASIGSGCHLDCDAPINIGSYAALSPKVTILTATHLPDGDRCRAGTVLRKPVDIGDGTWLGCGCTVLPGVTIGKMSIVGAGALVNRDVPDNAFVAGVPARVVKTL